MNLKNVITRIRERITRWVIVKYLSGGVNPHALLATRLGLRMCRDLHARYKTLTGDEYELPKLIFIAQDGSKYILTKFGFVPLQRERTQQELRELKVNYELLADKEQRSKKEIEKKELYIQELRSHTETLKSAINERNVQLAENSFSDVQYPEDNAVIERLKSRLEHANNELLKEREKNTRMIFAQADKLGSKKKSYILKIISSDAPAETKLSRIEKYLISPKV